MSSLNLANSRFRGITVQASKRFIGDRIRPFNGDTIIVEGNIAVDGNIEMDGLSLSATDTSLGKETPEASTQQTTAIGAGAGKNLTNWTEKCIGWQ